MAMQETSLQCFRKSQWEAILHYCKSTSCIISKKNWNKEHHDVCYVAGEKARLGAKRHREVKKSSLYVAFSIVELLLAEGII